MSFNYFAMILTAVALVACGTSPTYFDRPRVQQTLTIERALRVSTHKGWLAPRPTDRFVMPGKYMSAYADTEGIYFVGPASCLQFLSRPKIWKEEDGPIGEPLLTFSCGIYVPNDVTHPAYVFTIAGTDEISRSVAGGYAVNVPMPAGATSIQAVIAQGLAEVLIVGAVALEKGNFVLTNLRVERALFIVTTP